MNEIITEAAAIGIDLGDREAIYAVINHHGEIFEEGRVPMTPTAFRDTFGAFEPATVAIEAGGQSRWVSQVLEDSGHEVIVANPRQVALITASNKKNDANDARLLARLARADATLLHPIEHRPDQDQITLLSVRARALLVETRTALLASVRSMAKCFGIRLPQATSESFLTRCLQAIPERLRPHLAGLLETIGHLTRNIERYDNQLEAIAAQQYPAVQHLTTIPGVGTLSASTFVATLSDPERFPKSRDVGAFLGLRPRQRQSGERNPQLGISKAGDVYLRKLLVQCAHCLLREYAPDTALKQWGMKLCARGGPNAKKRAVVAVARKLAVLLHKLWINGEEFRPFPATH